MALALHAWASQMWKPVAWNNSRYFEEIYGHVSPSRHAFLSPSACSDPLQSPLYLSSTLSHLAILSQFVQALVAHADSVHHHTFHIHHNPLHLPDILNTLLSWVSIRVCIYPRFQEEPAASRRGFLMEQFCVSKRHFPTNAVSRVCFSLTLPSNLSVF